MSPWGLALAALLILAALGLLLLALMHVRYSAEWRGAWGGMALSPHDGFARLEVGFPGFMQRAWEWPNEAPEEPEAPPPPANEEADRKESRPLKISARLRRALFRFVTDGPVWKFIGRYVFSTMRRGARLLHLHVAMAAGHPDPVFLGKAAGYWHSVHPLLPLRNVTLDFRFQDRQPSFHVRVAGAFSLLALVWFGVLLLLTFPFVGLTRRAWHAWKHHDLTGWRAWVYRRLQG